MSAYEGVLSLDDTICGQATIKGRDISWSGAVTDGKWENGIIQFDSGLFEGRGVVAFGIQEELMDRERLLKVPAVLNGKGGSTGEGEGGLSRE